MTSFKRSLWLVAVVLCLTQPLAAQEWTPSCAKTQPF